MKWIVLPATKNPGISGGLTYDAGDTDLREGMLVKINLRKKDTEGLVLGVDESKEAPAFDVKFIQEKMHDVPVLSEAQVKTLRWMADYYHCSVRGALTPFLPGSPWRTLLPQPEKGLRRTSKQVNEKLGKRQEALLDQMEGKEWVSLNDLRRSGEWSSAAAKSLIEKGYVEAEEKIDAITERKSYEIEKDPHALTEEQRTAYEAMKAEKKPSLLFGITGSGKTEVYAEMIADMAKQGKQSILLVPEILLTEHTIHRFEAMFHREHIAVLHSRLTPASRRAEWKRIHTGEAALVIGSRSALFAPCRNLGLVVIDEEHEWTYKNEQTPRYHARDTAEKLCAFAGAKLVLGSATPSLESWARTKNGQYHLARLTKRYKDQALPSVRVIDLAGVKFGDLYPFSPPLLEAIQQRLDKGEQTVLFLNRRGIATAILCLNCRRRLVSPESQLPYTVHRDGRGNPFLMDHFSGVTAHIPARCPHCQSVDLMPVGAGTQRLEELIAMRFPKARILRADSDTLKHPEQMRALLKKMRDREADILLGTQSVVKGLDLPEVTLAAVLLADVGLSLPHFRAGERVFQLLTQLTGRSGRAKPGDVIIQTFRPMTVEVVAAAEHKTEEYMETELKLRTTLNYPPASDMIRFLISGVTPNVRAKKLQQDLQKLIQEESMFASVMSAPTLFGSGKEWHVLLRGHNLRRLLPKLDLSEVTVDVDPIDCI